MIAHISPADWTARPAAVCKAQRLEHLIVGILWRGVVVVVEHVGEVSHLHTLEGRTNRSLVVIGVRCLLGFATAAAGASFGFPWELNVLIVGVDLLVLALEWSDIVIVILVLVVQSTPPQ